jgi:signal peptidase I
MCSVHGGHYFTSAWLLASRSARFSPAASNWRIHRSCYDEKVPEDQFVVFGDNRDNARDSRFVGTVNRDAIIGRVVKVFGGQPPQSD